MKKWNLAATFVGCALCAILMVGATYESQPCFTDAASGDGSSITTENKIDETSEVTVETVEDEAETIMTPVSVEAAAPVAVEGEKQERVQNTHDDGPKPVARVASSPEAENAKQKSNSANKADTQNESKVAVSSTDLGGSGASVKKESATSAAPEKASSKECTITIDGVEINYIESYGSSSAPDSDAGIWRGSDSTTDGSYGYFIGHNSTSFGSVANIGTGSIVSVTDCNGDSRSYEVVDSFVVPEGSHWSDISDRVTGYGESVVMQTCVQGGYQIVVAE